MDQALEIWDQCTVTMTKAPPHAVAIVSTRHGVLIKSEGKFYLVYVGPRGCQTELPDRQFRISVLKSPLELPDILEKLFFDFSWKIVQDALLKMNSAGVRIYPEDVEDQVEKERYVVVSFLKAMLLGALLMP